MCGRFTLATPLEILEALFEVEGEEQSDEPRYNIAPQTRILAVHRRRGKRAWQSLLWGALNPGEGRLLINARSETVATSPLFARAFAASRILIPADGFFEWTKDGARRRGRYFQRPGGGPFAFAGISVSPLARPEVEEPRVVILTTQASESVQAYHDRMPVTVRPEAFAEWLDPDANPRDAMNLMARAAETEWASYSVGPAVNNVASDGPDCIRRAGVEPERQGRLFQASLSRLPSGASKQSGWRRRNSTTLR